jgi:hypothetical protein
MTAPGAISVNRIRTDKARRNSDSHNMEQRLHLPATGRSSHSQSVYSVRPLQFANIGNSLLELLVGDTVDGRHVAEVPVMLAYAPADCGHERSIAVVVRFVDDMHKRWTTWATGSIDAVAHRAVLAKDLASGQRCGAQCRQGYRHLMQQGCASCGTNPRIPFQPPDCATNGSKNDDQHEN